MGGRLPSSPRAVLLLRCVLLSVRFMSHMTELYDKLTRFSGVLDLASCLALCAACVLPRPFAEVLRVTGLLLLARRASASAWGRGPGTGVPFAKVPWLW